jgi:hypothetical protein
MHVSGLMEAAGVVFSQAAWQRCVVHWYATPSRTPRAKMREVALVLKAIHAQESRRAVDAKVTAVATEAGQAGAWITTTVAERLAYLAFPSEHWRRIRTNNPLEQAPKNAGRGCVPGRREGAQPGCGPAQTLRFLWHQNHRLNVGAKAFHGTNAATASSRSPFFDNGERHLFASKNPSTDEIRTATERQPTIRDAHCRKRERRLLYRLL